MRLRKPMASSHSWHAKFWSVQLLQHKNFIEIPWNSYNSNGKLPKQKWKVQLVLFLRLIVLVFLFRCELFRQLVPGLAFWTRPCMDCIDVCWFASSPLRMRSSCFAPGGSMSPVTIDINWLKKLLTQPVFNRPSPTSAFAWGAANSKAMAAATISRPASDSRDPSLPRLVSENLIGDEHFLWKNAEHTTGRCLCLIHQMHTIKLHRQATPNSV